MISQEIHLNQLGAQFAHGILQLLKRKIHRWFRKNADFATGVKNLQNTGICIR